MISGEGPGEGVGCQGPRGVRLIDWGCWPDPVRLLCPALALQSSWDPTPGACLGQAYASPPEAAGQRRSRTTRQQDNGAAPYPSCRQRWDGLTIAGGSTPTLATRCQRRRRQLAGRGHRPGPHGLDRSSPRVLVVQPPGGRGLARGQSGPLLIQIWLPGCRPWLNSRGLGLSWSKGPFEAPQGVLAWDGWGDSGITADWDLPGPIRPRPGDRLPPLTPSRLGPSLGS